MNMNSALGTKKTRCIACHGSGVVMGGGMMMADCDNCKGTGKIVKADDEVAYLQIQASGDFDAAVKRIVEQTDMSYEDASQMLSKEFGQDVPEPKCLAASKLDFNEGIKVKKRGRPKASDPNSQEIEKG